MSWVDTLVVGIIIIGGLILMYRALKEPLDMVGGWIASGFNYLRGSISGVKDSGYDVISYG